MKKIHLVPGLFLIFYLIFGVSFYSLALEVPVFSPLRYTIIDVQGTAVYTDTVTMGNVISGEFHLLVQNGSGGANKVNLAEVYIGGKRLIKLSSKKELIDKKFKLLQDGELRISLTGPRDSFVVVSIIAKKLTQVPLVITMPQADGQAAMTNALLKIKKKPLFSSHGFVPSGSVISQTPKAGVYVKEKSKASITVSTGPALAYNLLPGTPDTLASSSVVDYNNHDMITDTEITEVLPGHRIARTKLEIGFTPTATVKDINDLLTPIGAQITSMLKGVNQAIVRIPDPRDLIALDALVAQIKLNHIVRYVLKGNMASTEALPPDVDVVNDPGLLPAIDHHLDVRAHAAWNVISLMGEAPHPPNLVVADNFGDGVPNKHFAVRASSSDFASGKLKSHGYHVLGILAGTFHAGDTTNPERDWVTGLYPSVWFPYLWAVDLQKGYDEASTNTEIIQRLAILGKNVVVNTSLALPCNGTFADRSCVEPAALSWIEKVRGSALFATGQTGPGSLENTFIHLTSAGNLRDDAPLDLDARYNSEWTAARLLAPLVITETATPVVNLTNTLVIENRQKSPAPLEGLGCSAPDSKFPGDLSGIGENVWSLMGSSSGAGFKSGTSMATPQVASLAAYLWDLRPTLTPQEIKDILIRTADSSPCGGINPMPLIDAYAAVLALDRGYANARVRGTLLDVVDASGSSDDYDWRFTEKDVEYYLGRFDDAQGIKDYSRYDLNGDGKTGGDTKAKFNLDMDYPPTYGTVHQFIEEAHITFEENELTDLGILCYYAYSPLYTGINDKRKDLLRDKCAKITAELTFLSEIEAGGAGELQIHAGYIVPGGDTQWSEGINITVTVIGGTAIPSSGTTGASGFFTPIIFHDGVSSNIIVTVVATDSGGRLVSQTIEATPSGAICNLDFSFGIQINLQDDFNNCYVSEHPYFSGSCSYTVACPSAWIRLKLVQPDPNNPNHGSLEVYSNGLRCERGETIMFAAAYIQVDVMGAHGVYNIGLPDSINFGGDGWYRRVVGSDYLTEILPLKRYQCDVNKFGESCSPFGVPFPASISITKPSDGEYNPALFVLSTVGGCSWDYGSSGTVSISGPMLTIQYTWTPTP